METTPLYLTLLFFAALEVFESNWQKSDTFAGVVKNNYLIYKKSVFIFILLNPTFFYALYLSISMNNYSFLMNLIIVLKFVDISFRLHLSRKIDNDEDVSGLIPEDMKYNFFLRYINVVIYPVTFYFSLL